MMSKFFIAFVLLTACSSSRNNGVPVCVQQKIDSIKALPVYNPPAQVYEYNYKGKKVYYFTADCCDQFDLLFTADCEYICAPSGGYTGRGDGKCADFKETATDKKLIWKDPRK